MCYCFLPSYLFLSYLPLVPMHMFPITHRPNPISLYCTRSQHHVTLLFLIWTITYYCSLRYSSIAVKAQGVLPHTLGCNLSRSWYCKDKIHNGAVGESLPHTTHTVRYLSMDYLIGHYHPLHSPPLYCLCST